jgi:hypothetical protein
MGGYGSGYHGSKKTTVELCRRMDVKDLLRLGVLKNPADSWGGLTWREDVGKATSVGYRVRQVALVFIRGRGVDYVQPSAKPRLRTAGRPRQESGVE